MYVDVVVVVNDSNRIFCLYVKGHVLASHQFRRGSLSDSGLLYKFFLLNGDTFVRRR